MNKFESVVEQDETLCWKQDEQKSTISLDALLFLLASQPWLACQNDESSWWICRTESIRDLVPWKIVP